jgi:predicted amidophosphoribosyltransferase
MYIHYAIGKIEFGGFGVITYHSKINNLWKFDMVLKYIENYHGLNHFYHIGWYFPKNHYQKVKDPLSNSILEFKDNNNLSVNTWCSFVATEIRVSNIEIDLILRMFSSSEITAGQQHPLSQVGSTLERQLDNAIFSPNLLVKTRNITTLHNLSGSNRNREVSGAYSFKGYDAVDKPNILIIDDILTTGASMREIARAINETQPNCNIYHFTILKTFDKNFDPYGVPNTEIYYCEFLEYQEGGLLNGAESNYINDSAFDDDIPF